MSAAADPKVLTTGTAPIAIGTIIWLAVKPLIRLLICLLSGIILTKRDLFPAAAARTIGQIIINVCFPFLLFSKIVPAFDSSNIHFIGPLALVAVLYHVIGITIAWSIKQFCWVPHRFRYGFLAAGAWSNIGDIPTAVLLGLTSSPPFNSSTDSNTAIAYLSVFLIVFNITVFSCGGHKLVLMDYQGPDLDPEQDRALTQIRRRHIFRRLCDLRGTVPLGTIKPDPEHAHQNSEPVSSTGDQEKIEADHRVPVPAEITEVRTDSPTPTIIDIVVDSKHEKHTNDSAVPTPSRITKLTSFLDPVFKSLLSPPSLSILIAIPISIVVPLKALFLPVNQQSIVIPTLPDGQPPLSFLLDAAQFIGSAAVPLGLICLGGALARLHLPAPPDASLSSSSPSRSTRFFNSFKGLPLTSITLLALSKLILVPIFGMLIVQSLVSHNIIPKDDKVLRLVCLICACLPTSTTQVYLTQVYSGTGQVEWLGAYLVPQYVLMVLTMTVYIGLVLKMLFG